MSTYLRRLVVRDAEVRPKNRYGRLRVLGEPFWAHYHHRWRELNVVCQCVCGTVCVESCDELVRGKTTSCGCLQACLSRKGAGPRTGEAILSGP